MCHLHTVYKNLFLSFWNFPITVNMFSLHQKNVASFNIWAVTQENLSLGFPTRSCPNQSAQLQRVARIVKFRLQQVLI